MPLPTTYDELRKEIGRHLGYTGVLANIEANTTRNADVESALLRGQRKFYFLVRPGEAAPYHVWSFLLRDLDLTLESGVDRVDLPEDFWRLDGVLMFGPDAKLPAIGIVPEEDIRALKAQANVIGPPKYAAVRARATNMGQRYEMLLYPTPDASYAVAGRYAFEPTMLSDDNPTPLGGALHSETLMAACLCAADERLNSEVGASQHCNRFAELLTLSVEADKAMVAKADQGAWPVNSDVSLGGLGVDRDYLDQQIALIMGFGPNPTAWTHGQRSELTRIRDSGIRRFVNPDILPGEPNAHRWSFLRPLLQLDLEEDREAYDLPDNVAMLDGPLTFAPDSSVIRPAIQIFSEPQVRHKLTASSTTGQPTMCAMRAKVPQEGVQGQEILFFPRPDDNYTVHYRAVLNPLLLPEGTSIPLGSPEHAETILAACLCAAEETAGVKRPMFAARYLELLRSSVDRDRRRHASETLGVHSTWRGSGGDDASGGVLSRSDNYVYYNGSVPQ